MLANLLRMFVPEIVRQDHRLALSLVSYRPTIEAIAALGRQTVGARVRRFREAAGLTQAALAQAADFGRVTLVRLENGEQSPRFKTLQAIARALKVDTPELLAEPESLPR